MSLAWTPLGPCRPDPALAHLWPRPPAAAGEHMPPSEGHPLLDALVRALPALRSVRVVDLAHCALSYHGAVRVARALQRTPVQTLSLAGNRACASGPLLSDAMGILTHGDGGGDGGGRRCG